MENINYTWAFGAPEVILSDDGMTNIVSKVFWTLIATIPGTKFKDTFSNITNVSKPSEDDFTPFKELTEEKVIQWIEAIEPIEQIKEMLAAKIAEQMNPKTGLIDFPFMQKPDVVHENQD